MLMFTFLAIVLRAKGKLILCGWRYGNPLNCVSYTFLCYLLFYLVINSSRYE